MMMKLTYIIAGIFLLTMVSCIKENMEVKKVDHSTMQPSQGEKLNIKVVNAEDPVCGMKTAEYLKDTANYKGKTYGFCNSMCKDKFKKAPEKYAIKE